MPRITQLENEPKDNGKNTKKVTPATTERAKNTPTPKAVVDRKTVQPKTTVTKTQTTKQQNVVNTNVDTSNLSGMNQNQNRRVEPQQNQNQGVYTPDKYNKLDVKNAKVVKPEDSLETFRNDSREYKNQRLSESLDKMMKDSNGDGRYSEKDIGFTNEKGEYQFYDFSQDIADLDTQKSDLTKQISELSSLKSQTKDPNEIANISNQMAELSTQLRDVSDNLGEIQNKQKYQNAYYGKTAYDKAVADNDEETLDNLYKSYESYDDTWGERRITNVEKIATDMASGIVSLYDIVKDVGGDAVAEAWQRDAQKMLDNGVINEDAFNQIIEEAKSISDFDAEDDALGVYLREHSAELAYEIQNGAVESSGGVIGKFIGEGLDSTANFLAQYMLLGETGSLAMMGTQSGTQKYFENLEKGYSKEVAFYNGLATGVISYLTEKIGMDNFVNTLHGAGEYSLAQLMHQMNNGKSNWSILANMILSQGEAEGLEELVEGNADFALDALTARMFGGEPVEYNAGDIFYSMLVGGFSGLLMGATGGAYQYNAVVNTREQYNALVNDGNALMAMRADAVAKNDQLSVNNIDAQMAIINEAKNGFEARENGPDVTFVDELPVPDLSVGESKQVLAETVRPNVDSAFARKMEQDILINRTTEIAQNFLQEAGVNMDVRQFMEMSYEERQNLMDKANKITKAFPNVRVAYNTSLDDNAVVVKMEGTQPIIIVNPNGDTSAVVSTVHEVVHTIENSSEYQELFDTVFPSADDFGNKFAELATGRYKDVYKNEADEWGEIKKEALTVTLTEDLMKDEGASKFIDHMAKYNTSTAYKLWYKLTDALSIFKGNSQLDKITSLLTSALEKQDVMYMPDGVAFNKKLPTEKQISMVIKDPYDALRYKGELAYPYLRHGRYSWMPKGFADGPIVIERTGLNQVITGNWEAGVHSSAHNLIGDDILINLDYLIEHPLAVFVSKNAPNPKYHEKVRSFVVFLDAVDSKGMPIIVTLNPKENRQMRKPITYYDVDFNVRQTMSAGVFNGIYGMDNFKTITDEKTGEKRLTYDSEKSLANRMKDYKEPVYSSVGPTKKDVVNGLRRLRLSTAPNTSSNPIINEYFAKSKQLRLIQNSRTVYDGVHQSVKNVADILTFQQAVDDPDTLFTASDFKEEDIQNALETGRVKLYSPQRFLDGSFVTPSLSEARKMWKGKDLYSITAGIDNVAWQDSLLGQFTPVSIKIQRSAKNNRLDASKPSDIKLAKEFFESQETRDRLKEKNYNDIVDNIESDEDYVYYYNLHQDVLEQRPSWIEQQKKTTDILKKLFNLPDVPVDIHRSYKNDGIIILNPDAKSVNSAETKVMSKKKKIDDNGNPYSVNSIKDQNRWSIQVPNVKDIPYYVETIRENFPNVNVEIKDGLKTYEINSDGDVKATSVDGDNYGYIGFHITWRDENGITNEIQVTPDFDTKLMSDNYYDKWRRKPQEKLTESDKIEKSADLKKSRTQWDLLDGGRMPSVISSILSSLTGRQAKSGFINQETSVQDLDAGLNSPTTLTPSTNNNVGVSSSITMDNPSGNDNISVPPSNNIIPQKGVVTEDGGKQADKDASGNKLNEAVKKYFARSSVRNYKGQLRIMYHGTDSDVFTVFDPNMSDDKLSFFFTSDPKVAGTYAGIKNANRRSLYTPTAEKPEGNQQRVYGVYLNLENPLIINAGGEYWSNISTTRFLNSEATKYNHFTTKEDYRSFLEQNGLSNTYEINGKGRLVRDGKTIGFGFKSQNPLDFLETIDGYEGTNFVEQMYSTMPTQKTNQYGESAVNTRAIAEWAYENGYDGVLINDVRDANVSDSEVSQRSDVAIAFKPEQIKSIEIANPTKNPDIRYSAGGRKALNNLLNSKDPRLLKRGQDLLEKSIQAVRMEADGATPEEIWRETGWIKKNDGKWRFQFYDGAENAIAKLVEKAKEFADVKWDNEQWYFRSGVGDTFINTIVGDDSDLFKMYPELNGMTIQFRDNLDPSSNGSYNPRYGTITINVTPYYEEYEDKNGETAYRFNEEKMAEGMADTFFHELQHAIQKIENFEGGSNLNYASQEIASKRRSEIQSKLSDVQRRLNNTGLSDMGLLSATGDYYYSSKNKRPLDEKYTPEQIELLKEYTDLQGQLSDINVTAQEAFDLYHKNLGEAEAREESEYALSDMSPLIPPTYEGSIKSEDVKKKYGLSNSIQYSKRSTPVKQNAEVVDDYGAIRQQQFRENNLEKSSVLNEEQKERTREMSADGQFSYRSYINEVEVKRAKEYMERDGIDKTFRDYMATNDVSMKNIVKGEVLLQELAKANDKRWEEVAAKLADDATVAGQALQAYAILQRLSPENQWLAIERNMRRMQAQLDNKYGNKAPHLEISPELQDELRNAKTAEEAQNARDKIMDSLIKQQPITFGDMINSWRYLAMLGNTRTHIRNFLGNLLFMPMIGLKNAIGTAIESMPKAVLKAITNQDVSYKTKSFVSRFANEGDRALYQAGKRAYDEHRELLEKTQKYEQKGFTEKTVVGKTLNKLDKANTWLLDHEDLLFAGDRYALTYAQVLKANGVTEETASPELKARANQTALLESLKATYRDANRFADWLNMLENSEYGAGKLASFFKKALIPYTKTPFNIIKRGVRYSGIGLLESITIGAYRVRNGTLDANTWIDNMASGMSGSAIMALGWLLARMGILRGKNDDKDRKKYFDQDNGFQDYSINVGNGSETIDWATPVVMPLVMGAEIGKVFEELEGVDGANSALNAVLNISANIFDPVVETSMLSSLKDSLSSYSNEGSRYFGDIITSAIASYIGQMFPTAGGHIARTIDDTRRTTSPNKGLIDKTWKQILNKIPFASKLNEPYINKNGEEQKQEGDTMLERFLLNAINPGYYKEKDIDKYDEELYGLYERTGEIDVLPSSTTKSITYDKNKMDFSDKEYTEWHKTRYSTEAEFVNQFLDSSEYKSMSDEERVKTIDNIRDYAQKVAKKQFLESRGYKFTDDKELADKDSNYIYDKELTTINSVIKSGTELYQYYDYKNNAGTKQEDKLKWLENSNLTDAEKRAIYELEGYKTSYEDAYKKIFGKGGSSSSKKKSSSKSSKNGSSKKVSSSSKKVSVGSSKTNRLLANPNSSVKISDSAKQNYKRAYWNTFGNTKRGSSKIGTSSGQTVVCPRCGNRVSSNTGRCPVCGATL